VCRLQTCGAPLLGDTAGCSGVPINVQARSSLPAFGCTLLHTRLHKGAVLVAHIRSPGSELGCIRFAGQKVLPRVLVFVIFVIRRPCMVQAADQDALYPALYAYISNATADSQVWCCRSSCS
jgi:hypothetical protein